MTKEIEELIRAAKEVVATADAQGIVGLVVPEGLVNQLETAINSIDLAEARAARKGGEK